MGRQRDCQPTIDRQRRQIEVLRRRAAELNRRNLQLHDQYLRAVHDARIANEEADHHRDEVVILESMVRDLRADRTALRAELASRPAPRERFAGLRRMLAAFPLKIVQPTS